MFYGKGVGCPGVSNKERNLGSKEEEEEEIIRGSSELKKWIPLISVADQIYKTLRLRTRGTASHQDG
jgi:hypothetical protein